jgi:transcriptional regulator with XRE-family HTH domain
VRRHLPTALVTFALVACAAGSAAAWPYRWVNRDGVVTYSDRPPREAGTVYEIDGIKKRVPLADEPAHASPTADQAPASHQHATPPPRVDAWPGAEPERSRTTPPRERDALVRLAEALRLRREAQRLAQIGQQLAMRASWREPLRAAEWMTASTRLSPERLAKIAEAEAGRRIGPEHASLVSAWLTSRAGMRVVDAITEPMTPRTSADFQLFAARLPEAPPSALRIAIVRRLLRTVGVGPLAFDGSDLVERRLRGLVTGRRMDAVVPSGYRPASERERHTLMLTALFRCRHLSDQELRRAADFWESPPARAVASAYREAVAAAVVTVTEPKLLAAAR